MAWTHYGKAGRAVLSVDSAVLTKNHRVSLLQEREGASWSLFINNVTTSDQGTYACQVNTAPPQRLNFHIGVVGACPQPGFSVSVFCVSVPLFLYLFVLVYVVSVFVFLWVWFGGSW